jgi:hypothetical protein
MDGWVMGDFLLFSPEAAGGARKRIIDHQPSAISHQPSAISKLSPNSIHFHSQYDQ